MDGFRNAVQAEMNKGGLLFTPTKTETPYTIKITGDTDVYSAPATMTLKNGIFTIVEEKNGYGKLKSGAGWVKLSNVKKV
jgi:hypothetical protein